MLHIVKRTSVRWSGTASIRRYYQERRRPSKLHICEKRNWCGMKDQALERHPTTMTKRVRTKPRERIIWKETFRILRKLRIAWPYIGCIICRGFGATSQELTSSPTSSPTVTPSATTTPNPDTDSNLILPTWAIIAMSVVGGVLICSVVGLYVRNKRDGYESAD